VVRGEASALFVEQELKNLAGAEMRDEDKRFELSMRIECALRGWHNLQRLADPASAPTGFTLTEIGSVGRPKRIDRYGPSEM